jgi:hypothetical protein
MLRSEPNAICCIWKPCINKITLTNESNFKVKYDVELNVTFPKTEDKGIRFGKYIVNTILTQSFKPKLEF